MGIIGNALINVFNEYLVVRYVFMYGDIYALNEEFIVILLSTSPKNYQFL